MAKWNRLNNCYSYAVNYPNKWLLVDEYHQAVTDLLDKNPNLKLVSRKDIVLGKEYIAYRFSNDDFHFMKRGKDGHWRHKMGREAVTAVSTKYVFGQSWYTYHDNYNSKLYLFEVLTTA